MEELIIGNERELRIHFHTPKLNSDGWLESYLITIRGHGLEATLPVENPPYGFPPSIFFENLSSSWQHWKAEYDWGAIEGEYDLSAKADKLGHIAITACLYSRGWETEWKAEVTVTIEAGQLTAIESKAKRFFRQGL